jgi:hypothetical protein
MDPQRFDELTRLLAGNSPRRQVLKALESALAAALVLLATAWTVLAEPSVTVSPSEGSFGTDFRPTATGLPPGTPVFVFVRDPTGEEHSGPGLGAVPPDGTWRIPEPWHALPNEPVGEYTLVVHRLDGTVLASTTFRVTGSPGATAATAPSTLPRMGDLSHVPLLVAGAGAGLASLGYLLVRRARP